VRGIAEGGDSANFYPPAAPTILYSRRVFAQPGKQESSWKGARNAHIRTSRRTSRRTSQQPSRDQVIKPSNQARNRPWSRRPGFPNRRHAAFGV